MAVKESMRKFELQLPRLKALSVGSVVFNNIYYHTKSTYRIISLNYVRTQGLGRSGPAIAVAQQIIELARQRQIQIPIVIDGIRFYTTTAVLRYNQRYLMPRNCNEIDEFNKAIFFQTL